jgi:hypothetical protein
MASGASEQGDDLRVGRTNMSNRRTRLVASELDGDGDSTGYAASPVEGFVLDVATTNDMLPSSERALDAIQATGTRPFAGSAGPVPGGNGVVGRGLNGVVGYEQTVQRDPSREGSATAGVLGFGPNGVVGEGTNGPGVLGRGSQGNPGVHAIAASGPTGSGVSGGPGVFASGDNGIIAHGNNGVGVVGVSGSAEEGVHGASTRGPGVVGQSDEAQGGVFRSRETAQVWLEPLGGGINDPSQLRRDARAGELLVLETVGLNPVTDERETLASLWFCIKGGPPNQSTWTKLA